MNSKLNELIALQLGQLMIQVQAQELQIKELLDKIKELSPKEK
jgi:hypothetical protein